jgi:hypothetical protein
MDLRALNLKGRMGDDCTYLAVLRGGNQVGADRVGYIEARALFPLLSLSPQKSFSGYVQLYSI